MADTATPAGAHGGRKLIGLLSAEVYECSIPASGPASGRPVRSTLRPPRGAWHPDHESQSGLCSAAEARPRPHPGPVYIHAFPGYSATMNSTYLEYRGTSAGGACARRRPARAGAPCCIGLPGATGSGTHRVVPTRDAGRCANRHAGGDSRQDCGW